MSSTNSNSNAKANPNSFDVAKFTEQVLLLSFGVFKELWLGLRYNLIPWNICLFGFCTCCTLFLFHKDKQLFEWLYVGKFYPTGNWSLILFLVFFTSSSFWGWAFIKWATRQRRSRQLDRVFCEAGLKSSQGRIPRFVFDKRCDEFTKVLRVTIAGATLDKFKKAKEGIESGLRIFIDGIKENRTKGTIDITYSEKEMPRVVDMINPTTLAPCKFLIGETRASVVTADIRKVPHILIAGQTGGGKSSFLRQFITTHILNCENSRFILIDLKEGLESHLFEGLSKVKIFQDVAQASSHLAHYEEQLPYRLNTIKEAGCLDYDGYIVSKKAKAFLEREFIVVDEAAELFLASDKTKSSDAQRARRILSDIARRGRAAGVHLIIATQRPDSKSLDPQVKANLPGVLSFQMVNDASSISVLGNGKATELPAIPGRGIWKEGAEMIEIQTPFLSHDAATELLKPLKEKNSAFKTRTSQAYKQSIL